MANLSDLLFYMVVGVELFVIAVGLYCETRYYDPHSNWRRDNEIWYQTYRRQMKGKE